MNAPELTGAIRVAVGVRDGRVSQVRIDSTRPQLADRLLAGKDADEAVAWVPRLYSICGGSQQIAAELALAAARGSAATVTTALTRRIEGEMAQEYLWRALIDWARAVGQAPDHQTLFAARSALANDDREPLREVVERAVLGTDARDWYAQNSVADCERWTGRGRTAAARFLADVQRDGPHHGACGVLLLPRFDEGETAKRVAVALDADADFERLPRYAGTPAETGAVARFREQPLVAAMSAAFGRSTLVRFVARLAELARIVCGVATSAPLGGSLALGAGRGLGWVETARGLLLHQIDLDSERISRYRIVAPTEWNFHPDGPLTQAMLGVQALNLAELERRTQWLLQSLDPCVAHTLRVAHA